MKKILIAICFLVVCFYTQCRKVMDLEVTGCNPLDGRFDHAQRPEIPVLWLSEVEATNAYHKPDIKSSDE
jgi:hypothetical protein